MVGLRGLWVGIAGVILAAGCSSKSNGSGSACPATDDLISDFTMDNGVYPVDGRQGGWYTYGDPTPTAMIAYDIDSAAGGPCSGAGSLHVKATG